MDARVKPGHDAENVALACTMTESPWTLHPQLAADTVAVGDLALTRVLLAKDANYPWLILVPRRAGVSELTDLPEGEQVQLLGEIRAAAAALKATVPCNKLNIATLGNMVPQLHVHVIARTKDDAAWPKPVWGAVPPRAYDTADMEALLEKLRARLDVMAV
jgi:diadenosine tetraphosphate (Ap4A) HIT family hydrolase